MAYALLQTYCLKNTIVELSGTNLGNYILNVDINRKSPFAEIQLSPEMVI